MLVFFASIPHKYAAVLNVFLLVILWAFAQPVYSGTPAITDCARLGELAQPSPVSAVSFSDGMNSLAHQMVEPLHGAQPSSRLADGIEVMNLRFMGHPDSLRIRRENRAMDPDHMVAFTLATEESVVGFHLLYTGKPPMTKKFENVDFYRLSDGSTASLISEIKRVSKVAGLRGAIFRQQVATAQYLLDMYGAVVNIPRDHILYANCFNLKTVGAFLGSGYRVSHHSAKVSEKYPGNSMVETTARDLVLFHWDRLNHP